VRFSRSNGIYLDMLTGRLLAALGACAMAACAQTAAGVAGPVTGFIFDPPSETIRPMLGIPGAAYLGDVVATGLSAAAVSPSAAMALGVQRTGRLLLYTGFDHSSAHPVSVPGAILGGNLFAWAADSSAAAVYSIGSLSAQIITASAKAPAAGTPIDLSSLPGPVAAMAFDGQRIILCVPGGIFIASASSVPQRIADAVSPTAIALANGSLYFADKQTQEIWQIANYATAPVAAVFANDSGVGGPVGLQVSADRQRLLVANAGSQKLMVYDIAARSAVQIIDLAFTPTRLDGFGNASVFVMNGGSPGPLYIARDGAPGKAAVFFVPAPAERRLPTAPLRP
jgi:hypothetical protein